MDKIIKYQQLVEDIINEYSRYEPAGGDEFETQTVFDRERRHYQLWDIGWRGHKRIRGVTLQVDIKPDGKIWIQYDGTEEGIANRLVELGVPKDEIVLAFHPPYKRPYTGFAVS